MATATPDSRALTKSRPEAPITRTTTLLLHSVTAPLLPNGRRWPQRPSHHQCGATTSDGKRSYTGKCWIDPGFSGSDQPSSRRSPVAVPGSTMQRRRPGSLSTALIRQSTHHEGFPSAPTNLPKQPWPPTAVSARSSVTTPTPPQPAIDSASCGRRAHTTSPSPSATTPRCRRLLVTATAEPAGPPGIGYHHESTGL